MLQLTEAGINMFNTIDVCINSIDSHGGFTVIRWYKRGIINDQSIIADSKINSGCNINGNSNNTNKNISNDDMQVDSGDISYHLVHIATTNHDFLDYTTGVGQQLEALKFNVAGIKNM